MSLTNYADLQTALSSWLTHTLFTTQYPDFVTLFEASANRRMRVRKMEATSILTPANDGTVTLPTDYLAHRRATWLGTPRNELEFVEPSYFQAAYPSQPSDTPRFFTIEGGSLRLMPISSTNIEFDYYQAIPTLVTNSTNWLMTAHPDIYLFGSLVEASAFGVDDERLPVWKMRRDELFNEIKLLDMNSRTPSAVRVFGWTP